MFIFWFQGGERKFPRYFACKQGVPLSLELSGAALLSTVMSTTTYEGCVLASQGNDTVALQCLGRHLTSVSNDVQTVSDDVHSLQMGVDIFFLIFAATIMFFMQAGFTMLCAGSVRVSVTYFLVMVTRYSIPLYFGAK